MLANRSSARVSDDIRSAATDENSVKQYFVSWRRFRKWLDSTHPECTNSTKDIKNKSHQYDLVHVPVPDAVLDEWFAVIGWSNGKMLTVSTPTGFWSAMMHIYKKHDIEVPDSTYNQWIQYRKGLKNVRAKRLEEGNLSYVMVIISFHI